MQAQLVHLTFVGMLLVYTIPFTPTIYDFNTFLIYYSNEWHSTAKDFKTSILQLYGGMFSNLVNLLK